MSDPDLLASPGGGGFKEGLRREEGLPPSNLAALQGNQSTPLLKALKWVRATVLSEAHRALCELSLPV